jgi:hypothetical protein
MQSRENSRSKSTQSAMNMRIGRLISLMTMQTLRNVFALFILFFSACTLGLAQSKKEQIAVLSARLL